MSKTHGGRAKGFKWEFQQDVVEIKNEDGKIHAYSIGEITAVCTTLLQEFGHGWFPLANNVEKMYKGTEIHGLGSTIYDRQPGDTSHAQGASYLGVVLEEAGLLEWNAQVRGICWRIVGRRTDAEGVAQALKSRRVDPGMPGLGSSAEAGANHVTYTIETHKHNFAVWAAARAAQRGWKSATVGKLGGALESSGIKDAVTRIGNTNVDPKEYDGWHTDWCSRVMAHLQDAGVQRVTYGRAAKLVAIYLKVMVIIGEDPMCPLAKTAHPPIDGILLKNIAKAKPTVSQLDRVRWTRLSRTEYLDVVNDLRSVMNEGAPFWEIEKYWTATND